MRSDRWFGALQAAVAVAAGLCSVADAGAGAPCLQEAGPSAMRVELLDAGSEPRRALRYGGVGEVERFRMEIESSVRAEREGGGAEMPVEEVSLVLEVEQRSEAEGDQRIVTARIVSADTARGGAEAESIQEAVLRRALRRLAGVEVRTVRDARGVVLSDEVRVPEDADAATKQIAEGLKHALMQTVAPFPEAAAGSGARWRVRVPLVNQGIAMVQEVEYEIVSVEGDALELRMEVASSADAQEVRGIRVASFDGRGKGKAEVRLGRMSAARVEVEVETRAEYSGGPGAGPGVGRRVQTTRVRTVVRER